MNSRLNSPSAVHLRKQVASGLVALTGSADGTSFVQEEWLDWKELLSTRHDNTEKARPERGDVECHQRSSGNRVVGELSLWVMIKSDQDGWPCC
jgi:hypothetical protein